MADMDDRDPGGSEPDGDDDRDRDRMKGNMRIPGGEPPRQVDDEDNPGSRPDDDESDLLMVRVGRSERASV